MLCAWLQFVRREQRQGHKRGRQLNNAQETTEQHSRRAHGGLSPVVAERELNTMKKIRLIMQEHEELCIARGGATMHRNFAAMSNVFESYLAVHYGGRYSGFDMAKYPGFDAEQGM